MIRALNKNNCLSECLSVFLILFLSSSFVVINDIIPSTVTRILWIVALIISFPFGKKIPLRVLLIFFSVSLIMLFSSFYHNENMIVAFFYLVAFFVAACSVVKFGKEKFIDAFVSVVSFLAIVSLVGYLSFIIFPFLSNTFIVRNVNDIPFSNYFLFVHLTQRNSSFYRNWGMFWEPGAYQIFLCIACLFEARKKEPNLKRIVLFFITTFTTFSTTGYIALALILIYTIFKKTESKSIKKTKTWLVVLVVVFAVVFFIANDLFFSTSDYSVFGKIINFFERDFQTGRISSASIRLYSITKPISAFLTNPIIGVGQTNLVSLTYSYTAGMNLCTMVNWFAVYGVFYGFLMCVGIWKLSKEKSFFYTLLVFAFFFVVTMSENVMHNAFIFSLIICGYSSGGVSYENNSSYQLLQYRKYRFDCPQHH